jgi:chromate reductase
MTEPRPLHFLGISGSLRKASYNTSLLRAAGELLPAGVTMETYEDLRDIPPYDADVHDLGIPEPVQVFRERIRACDALVVCSPEYNFSLPGVLKNAIDWASRPPEQPFADKPVIIMGGSPGNYGTVRMQNHFRLMAVFLDMHLLNKPGVMVTRVHEKIDADGHLHDEGTRKVVAEAMQALAVWTRRLQKA